MRRMVLAMRHGAKQVFDRLPRSWKARLQVLRTRFAVWVGPFRRRPRSPIHIPGRGPVVLLYALGTEWPLVEAEVERRREAPERLVVVTDQPVMHVARRLPIVVEMVPAVSGFGAALLERRLEEIVRVYAVERTEMFTVSSPELGLR